MTRSVYRLTLMYSAKKNIRQLWRRFRRRDMDVEFFLELGIAMEQLQRIPTRCGDPLRNYRHAKIVEYRMITKQLLILYGVHKQSKSVFIRDIVENPLKPSV